jgi:L,D-peptidoglycan transpeptidase YkuD (ErfK/YbiS/YcfS/YnhG family)
MKKLPQITALTLGLAALVTAGVVLSLRADAATTVPAYDPAKLTHLGDARQLIVVAGVSRSSTYATLRTYQLGADGKWVAKFGAMPARNGYAGWAPGGQRVQGSGTTPRGTYPITGAFGLKANPGTKLGYRHADANDYWVGDNRDPKTYNLVQHSASAKRTWRISEAERLAAYPVQYEAAAVIGYNEPAASTVTVDTVHDQYVTSRPVNVLRGSAIFLHVNGKGSTAGCVSLSRANLLAVLKWLDPAMKPRIAMAPFADLGST